MSVRNLSYLPVLGNEGYFDPPMPAPKITEDQKIWYMGLKPFERLYYHQTLNSARKNRRYHPNPNIPKDNLDFLMQAYYDHSQEVFPDKVDFFMQCDTVGIKSFRLLRNRKVLNVDAVEKLSHPLIIGGTKDKKSPHCVKLINSGHHTQLTNNGYSRQPADGTFFKY